MAYFVKKVIPHIFDIVYTVRQVVKLKVLPIREPHAENFWYIFTFGHTSQNANGLGVHTVVIRADNNWCKPKRVNRLQDILQLPRKKIAFLTLNRYQIDHLFERPVCKKGNE
jgi:hypothetical protein